MDGKIKKTALSESLGFWKDAGVTSKYLSGVIFNNFVAQVLGGIGLGLLIPLANGVIKENFSLVTKSFLFTKIASFFPVITKFDNLQIFLLLSILILILNIFKSVINYRLDLYQNKKNFIITSNITRNLFKDQISLGKAFTDEANGGSYSSQMSRVPIQINSFLESLESIISSSIEIIIYCFILLFISPVLFISTIPLVPVILFSVFFLKKKLKSLAKDDLEGDTNLSKGFYNSVIRTPLIRVYNTEAREIKSFDEFCAKYVDKKIKIERFLSLIKPIQDILVFLALFLVVLILNFYSHLSVKINVASLLVFFVTFRQLLSSANSIATPIIILPMKIALVESIKTKFKKHAFKKNRQNGVAFEELKESIICKNLHFSYKPHKPILKGLSCVIPKGKTTAIVGKSGSGKTTLVNLILRLYDCPKNSIFFDGVDINNFTKTSVRRPFSYVSQDILLFDDTLKNNICYGLKEEISDSEIFKILKEVNLIPVLERLDDGLNTNIGDRGVQLSGGERQRVALARAILNESSIVVFDEPTSSVDIESEIDILNLIEKYKNDKTIIIIAHSFLTIKNAEHVVVLEDGKTKEEGSIKDLISKKSDFYKFWKAQQWDMQQNRSLLQ